MPFFLVSGHTTEVRPYARAAFCCRSRHHFRACPTPAPAVTVKLIHRRFRFTVIRFGKSEDRAGLRFYVLFLFPHAAVLTPGSRSLHIPIPSRPAMAFAHTVGARRVACTCGRFIPVLPTLPAIRVGADLSRSCNVHLMLRPADSVGVTDWVGPRRSRRGESLRSPSGLPCRGKFRRAVTNPTRPLPIQPNGILLNQTPYILEETNFKPRTRGR